MTEEKKDDTIFIRELEQWEQTSQLVWARRNAQTAKQGRKLVGFVFLLCAGIIGLTLHAGHRLDDQLSDQTEFHEDLTKINADLAGVNEGLDRIEKGLDRLNKEKNSP